MNKNILKYGGYKIQKKPIHMKPDPKLAKTSKMKFMNCRGRV